MKLTPLETMFVEEFCRFVGISKSEVSRLRVIERDRNEGGFVTSVEPESVPLSITWGSRFFKPDRVASVGPKKAVCMMLLVFDPTTKLLESIEGDVFDQDWPEVEEPAYWSESIRAESSPVSRN